MEIILKQDIDDLGFEGDIVKVAKGYARNYLIPKGIALEATPQNIKVMEFKRKKIEVRRLKAKEEAEKLKENLEGLEITFFQKAGEEGKLYGSVTSMDIAEGLEKKGIVVDRRKISLEKPLKNVGEFKIPVKIYPGITGNLNVLVKPEESQSD
jgi:large subunit ribosomal protein L9